jgi:glycosyltransferase involved in cell wall biosynthesis
MTRRHPAITAAIIARDEEANIGDCLRSIDWANELLVLVDAATCDRTREVALSHGARMAEQPFENFAAQRDQALKLATGEWVLFVDADERVPLALRDEVLSAVTSPGERVGFWIRRDNYLCGRLVRGAGWYPDFQLRLLKRGAARFDPKRVVHEQALLDGPAGHLRNAFVHFNYRTLGEFVRKQERYACLEAQRWLATHGRPRLRALLGQPAREFCRRYLQLQGYREGMLGLLLSVLLAWYAGKAVWLARHRRSELLHGGDRANALEERAKGGALCPETAQ